MIKLPFHMDTPWPNAAITLSVAAAFGLLLWAYDRETTVAKVLKLFLEWIYASRGIIKAHQIGRWMIITQIVVFAALALFSAVVGIGLIKNGDAPQPVTLEELRAGYFRKP